MPSKLLKRNSAAKRIANLLIEHMEETMSPAQGKATLRDLKTFSLKSRSQRKKFPHA